MSLRWRNTPEGYGAPTKLMHWLTLALVLPQIPLAILMRSIGTERTLLGLAQGDLYNWHKSLGLIVLILVGLRYAWRRSGPLPDWAPGLAPWERDLVVRLEPTLYLCLFLMPVSGFMFVMAGGYGVHLFGLWELPRFPPKQATLAWIAELVHLVGAYILVAALTLHLGLVVKHQRVDRDGLIRRMLPGRGVGGAAKVEPPGPQAP